MGVVYSLYDHSRKEFYCVGKHVSDVFCTDEWANYGGVDYFGNAHSCHPACRYATVEELTAAILDDFRGGSSDPIDPEVEAYRRRIARGAFAFMQGRKKVCIHDDCSYDEPDGYQEVDDEGKPWQGS